MVRMVDEDNFNADDDDAAGGHEAGRQRLRKTADAFRTISEVADELHVPQHVLRFWETKFPQVRPLKRGGGRRYYRPEDVGLLRRVADLLYTQGYTIKGVQRLLREGGGSFQDNIPPALAEERLAAEAERHADIPAESAVAMRKPVVPQPEMPGLLSEAPEVEPVLAHTPIAAEPTAEEPNLRQKTEAEIERLRNLLSETLLALEELRRLLD
ncbi:DNA-binding transcriptional MerR regulator [Acidocella aromatica]|uniref:DNA-binding transcriptional MerR regulator n=1 Tax=Acidocella aromatica TaxID=1303579 RepID=A0A840V9K3_9PROT|nr:DNA-binding transcriptional MerR regulator [Acidocella aromatica]